MKLYTITIRKGKVAESSLRVTTMCFILVFTIGRATAFADVVPDSTVLLYNLEGQIWTLDPFNGELTLFVEVELDEDYQVLDIEMDRVHELLYVLEGQGYGFVLPGDSHLRRINLHSNVQEIIFEGRSFIEMILAPNGEYAVMLHWPPEETSIRGLKPHLVCVLFLEERECQPLELDREIGYGIWWRDDERFFINRYPNTYLFDAITLERTDLLTYLYDPTAIPSSDHLLLSTYPGSLERFRIFNLETLEVTPIHIGSGYSQDEGVHLYSFSPDGEYLLFEYDDKHLIARFSTREIVAQLEGLRTVQWLDNSQSLIATRYAQVDSYPLEIVRYDLAENQFEHLADFNENVSLIVVP